MERKIPLPMLILAILGFCYLLFPILVVVLAGLTTGEFSDLSAQRVVAALGDLFPELRKIPLGLLLFVQAGPDDDDRLDHLGHGGGLVSCAVALCRARRPAGLLPIARGPAGRGRRVCPLRLLHHQRMGISRTIWGLWIGHILYSTPYVIGTVGASLATFDVSLEEAARSLGASPMRAFRKITFPNIAQGIQAGSIFAFIVSFGQFEVSLFLSAPNSEPLPIAMYNSLRYKFEPDAAAAGIFAITLVIASVLLTNRLVNIRRLLERQDG